MLDEAISRRKAILQWKRAFPWGGGGAFGKAFRRIVMLDLPPGTVPTLLSSAPSAPALLPIFSELDKCLELTRFCTNSVPFGLTLPE